MLIISCFIILKYIKAYVQIQIMLRGRYTRMCCLLTNIQHSKSCYARERTEKATIITKKRDFHHIKRRNLAVQRCFYIFEIIYVKKVFQD